MSHLGSNLQSVPLWNRCARCRECCVPRALFYYIVVFGLGGGKKEIVLERGVERDGRASGSVGSTVGTALPYVGPVRGMGCLVERRRVA